MEQQRVDIFIMSNQKYFPDDKIMYLREKLKSIDEARFSMLSTIEFKNPTTIFFVSLFLGGLGIDRFMLGDTGMGVLKLLTGGVCGILLLIDWFTMSQKVKELNFNNIMAWI